MLAFMLLDFVSAKTLFRLGVRCVLTSDRVILFQANLIGRILRIFGRVVTTVTS